MAAFVSLKDGSGFINLDHVIEARYRDHTKSVECYGADGAIGLIDSAKLGDGLIVPNHSAITVIRFYVGGWLESHVVAWRVSALGPKPINIEDDIDWEDDCWCYQERFVDLRDDGTEHVYCLWTFPYSATCETWDAAKEYGFQQVKEHEERRAKKAAERLERKNAAVSVE